MSRRLPLLSLVVAMLAACTDLPLPPAVPASPVSGGNASPAIGATTLPSPAVTPGRPSAVPSGAASPTGASADPSPSTPPVASAVPSPSGGPAVQFTRLTTDGRAKYGVQVSPAGNAVAWIEEPESGVEVVMLSAPLGSAPREVFRSSTASHVSGLEGPQKGKLTPAQLANGYNLTAWHAYLRFSPDGAKLLLPVQEGNSTMRYDDWALIDVASGAVTLFPLESAPGLGAYQDDGYFEPNRYYASLDAYGEYALVDADTVVYLLRARDGAGARPSALVMADLGAPARLLAGYVGLDPTSGAVTPGELPPSLDDLTYDPVSRLAAVRGDRAGQTEYWRVSLEGAASRVTAGEAVLSGEPRLLPGGTVYLDQGFVARDGALTPLIGGTSGPQAMAFHDGTAPGLWMLGYEDVAYRRAGAEEVKVPIAGLPAGWRTGIKAYGSEYDYWYVSADGRVAVVPIVDGGMDLMVMRAAF